MSLTKAQSDGLIDQIADAWAEGRFSDAVALNRRLSIEGALTALRRSGLVSAYPSTPREVMQTLRNHNATICSEQERGKEYPDEVFSALHLLFLLARLQSRMKSIDPKLREHLSWVCGLSHFIGQSQSHLVDNYSGISKDGLARKSARSKLKASQLRGAASKKAAWHNYTLPEARKICLTNPRISNQRLAAQLVERLKARPEFPGHVTVAEQIGKWRQPGGELPPRISKNSLVQR